MCSTGAPWRLLSTQGNSLRGNCYLRPQEENWTLKDSIKMLQEGKKLLEQKMSDAQKDWEKQLTASKAQAEKVLSQTLAKMKDENNRTCNLLREEISSSKEEISKLTKQMQNLEKEKHGEITKLRLKYDAKLLHLQQETAKAQQHAKSPMNSAVTHIFRQVTACDTSSVWVGCGGEGAGRAVLNRGRKYINTKQATDKEIQSLKQTIASLQKKLEQKHEGATSAKKRRF
ncbi:putative coiled-coil domain-containing protein [Apostichopus japonicus]|uniref:Putative coiled-coil domain-containing protein n=1 Tax=Stichopus japonicus TaxID=307972 RepID=A0A2G8LHW2_STIJA|nr:putative coiled-coil domain-containing protein [Apostichopus japonicus]